MEILDEVMTEEGPGIVVGFPAGDVEVRYPNEGRRLKIWPRDSVSLVQKEAVVPDDTPRGKSGRPLSGAALAKHQAKQKNP